jgi:hypothetical protein
MGDVGLHSVAEQLSPTDAAELLRRQAALQREAEAVVAELDLPGVLGRIGIPEWIGSSRSGLMVWRDLDFGVRCDELTAERVYDAMRPIVTHQGMVRVEYADETGERSPSGLVEDQRYYYACHFLTTAGDEWKIDLSLWTSSAPRSQLAHLEMLRARLNDETRLAILWIKDVWSRLPAYPYEVGGTEVYDAVLEHGVRTPGEFDTYLRHQGLPGRN